MSKTHDGSSGPPMDPCTVCFRRRWKAKAHKILEGKLRFVVGQDVYMDRVEALCSHALIGRLEYCSMDKKAWFSSASEHWKPFLSYVPAISLLAWGWIVFVFLVDSHASSILNRL